MDEKKYTIYKEMALTHSDFFHWLPKAIKGKTHKVEGSCIKIESSDGIWTIQLGKEGKRHLALLSIPTTPVMMIFEGYSTSSRNAALERFDRAFHRGGG